MLIFDRRMVYVKGILPVYFYIFHQDLIFFLLINIAYTEHALHGVASVFAQNAAVGVKSLDELLGRQHGENVLQQQQHTVTVIRHRHPLNLFIHKGAHARVCVSSPAR